MSDTYTVPAPRFQVGPVQRDAAGTFRQVTIVGGITTLPEHLHSVEEVVAALRAAGHSTVTAASLGYEEGTGSADW